MFSIKGIVNVIVGLLIFGCIFGLLWYLIEIVPIPQPYKGWLLILLQVLGVLGLIGVLLQFAGYPIIRNDGKPLG
jgi:hypothetical protein